LAVLSSVLKAKPSATKGQYLKKIHLSTTMGPGIKINLEEAKRSVTE
jgi:large subunit ribosomal protein L1